MNLSLIHIWRNPYLHYFHLFNPLKEEMCRKKFGWRGHRSSLILSAHETLNFLHEGIQKLVKNLMNSQNYVHTMRTNNTNFCCWKGIKTIFVQFLFTFWLTFWTHVPIYSPAVWMIVSLLAYMYKLYDQLLQLPIPNDLDRLFCP